MKSNLISDTELQAYVDGFLSEERRQAVEAELLCNPSLQSEVAIWQRQNETLRALYAPALDEPLPTRILPDNVNKRVLVARQKWWRMAAAAVFLAALGGLGGWFGRDLSGGALTPPWPLAREAMVAHSLYASEIVHPVEVKAEQEQHLSAWLSRRLDRTLNVPDLRAEGLSLVGGRLLPAQGGPAAQLMYEDPEGKRVTLFIVPSDDMKETSLRYLSQNNLEALVWTDNAISCVLVGDMPRARLQKIALSAYKQFE